MYVYIYIYICRLCMIIYWNRNCLSRLAAKTEALVDLDVAASQDIQANAAMLTDLQTGNSNHSNQGL